MVADLRCSLCNGSCVPFHQDRRREYWRCERCRLVQVPPAWHLEPHAEKAIYDLHQNDTLDAGYRRFLTRMAGPLVARLPPGAEGLDFGCGPAPALADMLKAQGFKVELYDLFYQPDESVFSKTWDFITATEVVEHLARPGPVLDRLWERLRPNGWLGIMTKRVIDEPAFARWHYKNDLTHICFFSEATFAWLAERWQAELQIVGADVVLLQRKL